MTLKYLLGNLAFSWPDAISHTLSPWFLVVNARSLPSGEHVTAPAASLLSGMASNWPEGKAHSFTAVFASPHSAEARRLPSREIAMPLKMAVFVASVRSSSLWQTLHK